MKLEQKLGKGKRDSKGRCFGRTCHISSLNQQKLFINSQNPFRTELANIHQWDGPQKNSFKLTKNYQLEGLKLPMGHSHHNALTTLTLIIFFGFIQSL